MIPKDEEEEVVINEDGEEVPASKPEVPTPEPGANVCHDEEVPLEGHGEDVVSPQS